MNGTEENTPTKKKDLEATSTQDQPSPQQSGPDLGGLDSDRLQQFHSRLLSVQGQSDLEGIDEDFESFAQAFSDPFYRQRFHRFLLRNQGDGPISGIPSDYKQFESGFMAGEPPEPEGGEPAEGGRRPSGSDLPSELQQMDVPLSQATDEAFDATERLGDYADMETYQQTQAERIAKSLAGDQYDVRTADQLGRVRQAESDTAEEVRGAQQQRRRTGDPTFNRAGGLEFTGDPATRRRLRKATERLASIRETKNRLLNRQEQRFQQQYSPSERLGFKWEAGKKQVATAKEGYRLTGQAEELEMMNAIDRGDMSALPVGRHDFAGVPASVRTYMDAEPEKRKEIKADLVNQMASRVENITGIQEAMQEIPRNPHATELLQAETAEQAWQTFKESPIDIISTLGITSLPFSSASLVGGVLGGLAGGPTGAAAGVGLGSGMMEYAAGLTEGIMREVQEKGYSFDDILSELSDAGVDTEGITPESLFGGEHSTHLQKILGSQAGEDSALRKQIMQVVQDPEAMDRVRKFARQRGLAIGAMDAAGTFVPAKTLTSALTRSASQATSGVTRAAARAGIAGTAGLGITVDAMAGGMGEALAQMINNDDLDPGEISAELVGELITGPLEITGATASSIFNEMGYEGFRDYVRSFIDDEGGPAEGGPQEAAEEAEGEQAQPGAGIPGGPVEIEETPEATERIEAALGQAEGTAQPIPTRDVRGRPVLSPQEFQELPAEQREQYQQTVTQPVTTPEGSEIQIDQGLAPFAQRIMDMGLATGQSDSGMAADHPGQRRVEDHERAGEVFEPGRMGYMSFWNPESGVEGRRNTASQIQNVREAAEEAGMVVESRDIFFEPSTVVRFPAAADGTSRQQILAEANERANEQAEVSKDEDFDAWLEVRNSLVPEVTEEHGGPAQFTDQEIARRWERFTQELERREGATPTPPADFEVDAEADLDAQTRQVITESERIRRARNVAERQGQPTEQFDRALQQLSEQRSRIANERDTQRRQRIAQQGTIEDAIGQQVVMGEYQGTLEQDTEGNVVVNTGEQLVEVPDTRKDLSMDLSETQVARDLSPRRRFEPADEPDAFELVTEDPATGETQTQQMQFLESGFDDAGALTSVTMATPEGEQRTFRQPDLVEQVAWEQYFSGGVDVEAAARSADTEIARQEVEVEQAPGEEISVRLDDPDDQRLNLIFNKFDRGEPLSETEQTYGMQWIDEKMAALEETNPENADEILNFLSAFENEILENDPQPTPQAEPDVETEGEAGPAADQSPEEGAQPAEQEAEQPGQPEPAQQPDEQADVEGEPAGPTHQQMPDEYIRGRISELPDDIQADQELTQHIIDTRIIPDHKRAVGEALERGDTVPEQVLQAYPDLLEQAAPDPDAPKEDGQQNRWAKAMTRERFRQQLEEQADVTEEQIETVLSLIDKRAQVWARQNGRSEAEYWKRRFAGIRGEHPVPPDQVQEITEAWGVDSMQQVGEQIEERMRWEEADFPHRVESPNGPAVNYQSGRQLGIFEDAPEGSRPDIELGNPGQRTLQAEEGEFAVQERQYFPNRNWILPNPGPIATTDEVAWMMRELQDMAVEHIMLVGTDPEGQPRAFHLGKGTGTASLVDVQAVPDIVNRFDLERVWIVHNHPSGNVNASRADNNLWNHINRLLPSGVVMEKGVIMDRDSGIYGYFSPTGMIGERPVETPAQPDEAVAEGDQDIQVQEYGRFQLLAPLKASGETVQITSPDDVARLSDSPRFNFTERYSAMILDNAKQVVGFVHLQNVPGDPDNMAPRAEPLLGELQQYLSRFGGQSAVIATSRGAASFDVDQQYWARFSEALSESGFSVDDVINVAPDPSAQRTYNSLRSAGVFEPITSYDPHMASVSAAGVEYTNDERAVIDLVDEANDFEAIIRQLGQIFRKDMAPDDLATIEEWAGVEDGNWTEAAEQRFTDGFLSYVAAPEETSLPQKVKAVFARIAEWISEVVGTILQNDQAVTVTPDVRAAFDRLFRNPIEDIRNTDGAVAQLGSPISVSFRADGSENVQGQYGVIEARDLQASHNPDGSLNSRHIISKGQPRDRRGRKYVSQHKEIAQNLNPAAITGNGATAFYNAPTTNIRGEVIQGNGRSISLKIAYSENPGRATDYKNYLIEHADEWGLQPDVIGSMQRPVLVRVLPVDDSEAVRLGNLKNIDEAKMDPAEEAMASVRNMSAEQRQRIGNKLNESEAETLRAMLDEVGPELVDMIPGISRAEMLDDDNRITTGGKDFLVDVFQSLIFDSDAGRDTVRKFGELHHDIQRGIQRSFGTLLKYVGTPADLSTTLQNAVDIVWNVRRSDDMGTAQDFVQQQDIFGEAATEAYTDQEVALAQVLLDTLRPSSQLMKDLGTTGTQTAIRTLIRNYANRIEGETNLFESVEPAGNTPAGATQAFGETFGPGQPESPQQGEQGDQPRSAAAPEGDRLDTETITQSIRSTGLDRVRRFEPLREVEVPWLADQPATKPARDLLGRLQDDPEGQSVGIRSIYNFLNDQLGVDLRVGKENTTRSRPANLRMSNFVSRSRSPLDVAIFHEAGHAVHGIIEEDRPMALEALDFTELMDTLSERGRARASAETQQEYFAEWIRSFLLNPEFTMSLRGSENVLGLIEDVAPDAHRALLDTARLYQAHQARGTVAMTRSGSKDTGPPEKGWWDSVKDIADRITFRTFGRNWFVEQLERKGIWQAFREGYESRREADAAAREIMGGLRNTEADLRLAHQVLNRIPSIVKNAMNGSGFMIYTTGDGVQITENDLTVMREHFDIPDEIAAKLTDPTVEHGELIKLADSVADIVEPVAEDNWADFEWYAQYKVSLERLLVGRSTYPGISETSPQEIVREIKRFEAAHPHWQEVFEGLNNYLDRLLVAAVLGGDKSVQEAITMKQSYDFYMPLLRNLEESAPQAESRATSRSGPVRADAGFRRLTGEGDQPFMALMDAIQSRTTRVVDAYYSNRAMLAVKHMIEHVNAQEDVPAAAKMPLGRVMDRLDLPRRKVADLKPSEAAKVIADYLNQQRREQAAAEMGVEPDEVQIEEPLRPDDINVASPSMPIWRNSVPDGVNVIAVKEAGEYEYYQLGMPHAFDYFARTSNPSGWGKAWHFLAKGTAPWKRLLTNTLDFAFRNLPRDIFNATFMGTIPPEYAQDLPMAERIKMHTPGYALTLGLIETWTQANMDKIVDTDLISRAVAESVSDTRRFSVDHFKEVASRGVVVPGFMQMDLKEQIGESWGILNSLLLKPFELILHYSYMDKISTMFEELPRAGAYRHAKQVGLSDEVAMMAHDFVSGNFGERPANPNFYNAYRTGGFINPATQIFSETVRRVTHPDPKVRTWNLTVAAGMIATSTAAIWAVSRMLTPDDRLEELEERTNEERANYMPIMGYYKVPFDYGPVGALQALTYNSLDNLASDSDLPPREFATSVLKRLVDTPFTAESASGVISTLGGMVVGPQALSGIEAIADHEFYWNEPIVPPYMQFMDPEEQAYATTPGFYKKLGEMSGWSPLKIQHVANSMTGYLLGRNLSFIEKIEDGEPIGPEDLPFGGRLVQRTPTGWYSQSAQEVSELDRQWQTARQKMQDLAETATTPEERERVQELRDQVARLAPYHATVVRLQNMYDRVKAMRDNGDFEQARNLERKMTEVAAGMLARYPDNGDQQ